MNAVAKTQSLATGGLFASVLEAEQCYHGNILSERELPKDVLEGMAPDIFESKTHALIQTAINKLHQEGTSANLETVLEELRGVLKPDRGSWVLYLTQSMLTAAPCAGLALKEIKEAARMRKVWELGVKISKAAKSGDSEQIQSLIEQASELQFSDNVTDLRLKPVSAKDLKDIPRPLALWKRLIYPSCITILNSVPGAGKSTLVYNIAGLGAQGKEFLGEQFTKPIKTLYIDSETPTWLQRKKINSICGEPPEDFHLLNDVNLSRDIDDLIRLGKAENYDLIVFDTLSKVLVMEDENSNSEANKKAALISRLVKETEVAVLLIHHTKKGEGGQDVYRGRGASAISAAVDIVANIDIVDKDTLKLSIPKSRVDESKEALLIKKLGGDKFELVNTCSEENDSTELIKTAIEKLERKGVKVNQKAIAEYVNGSIGEKRLRSLLKKEEGGTWIGVQGQGNEILYKVVNGETAPPRDCGIAVLEYSNNNSELEQA